MSLTFDVAAVQGWLRLPPAGADDDLLAVIVAAATSYVAHTPTDPGEDTAEWPADITLGAVMLAARLYRRRNSPAGIDAITEAGSIAYAARVDPDVTRLLKLDLPAVG